MNTFVITFEAVAALLGIGILGFWIIGRRHLPANALGLLTSIAIDIALPSIVLANIITDFFPQDYPGWWNLPLWWLGFSFVAIALSLLASLMAKKETRGEFAMSLFFQNGIFFPLIVIAGIVTDSGALLVQLFLFIFLQPSLVFSTYPLFFRDKLQETKLRWIRIVNPVLVMTVIGIFIVLVGVRDYVPPFLVTIVTMIGAMAIPLFMLILGGNVYNDFMYQGKEGKKIYAAEVIKFTLVKNLLFPLVFLGLLILIRPEDSVALIIILQAAAPPITAIPIFTERSGGNRAITSQFIVASFLFAIVSIPAAIYLFSMFFPGAIR